MRGYLKRHHIGIDRRRVYYEISELVAMTKVEIVQ